MSSGDFSVISRADLKFISQIAESQKPGPEARAKPHQIPEMSFFLSRWRSV
jgi:hypothetical protein